MVELISIQISITEGYALNNYGVVYAKPPRLTELFKENNG